jgi:hypothetical protein
MTLSISGNSLFNANYINNFGYEYPVYSPVSNDAQAASEALNGYFSRLNSPYNLAGMNPYASFVSITGSSSSQNTDRPEEAEVIPEGVPDDSNLTWTNEPGKHELLGDVLGFKQTLVNDNKGREIENTVFAADGTFVYKSVSNYFECSSGTIEEKQIYDEDGKSTGTIIYYSDDATGSTANPYKVEYRDSSGTVLCVLDNVNGKWYSPEGKEIEIRDVLNITKRIYPESEIMKIYGDELQKNTQLIDRHVDISIKPKDDKKERLEDEQKLQEETAETQENPESKEQPEEITE